MAMGKWAILENLENRHFLMGGVFNNFISVRSKSGKEIMSTISICFLKNASFQLLIKGFVWCSFFCSGIRRIKFLQFRVVFIVVSA